MVVPLPYGTCHQIVKNPFLKLVKVYIHLLHSYSKPTTRVAPPLDHLSVLPNPNLNAVVSGPSTFPRPLRAPISADVTDDQL